MATAKKGFPPIVIVLIVVGVLVVAAGAFFMLNKGKMMGSSMMGGNAFTSIKDALTKSVSLECEYTDAQNVKSKYFIKNGAIRADMESSDPEQTGSMIMKDRKIYSWKGKEGFMMEIPEAKDDDQAMENDKSNEADNIIKDLEEYKDKCKASVVSDSLFTPPADVDFQDMSKMMNGNGMSEEDVKKMMEQYQGGDSMTGEEPVTDDSEGY
jgi:hypothetical protein